MSRSRRKTPIWSVTCSGMRAGNEKFYKRKAQRGLRKRVKQMLCDDPYRDVLPALRETSNTWGWPKDGKWGYCHNPKPEWMRK